MAETHAAKPFYSVLVLAFVCSALVAGAAVGLRPKQEANRQRDRQKNILIAAGLYRNDVPLKDLFTHIDTRLVDLETGEFVPKDTLDPQRYNQQQAPFTDGLGVAIPKELDSARLGRREKYSQVYLVEEEGSLSQVILPVRGKGLWSTMHAFVAVAADLSSIEGVSFYQHGETPGLGGEIENRNWQDSWRGKKIYKEDSSFGLGVTKGTAQGPDQEYLIDGLSGATLTTMGVDGLLQYWFGDHGYGPFLSRLQQHPVGGDNG